MSIEHSEAIGVLRDFAAGMERKLIDFPGMNKPIYARPVRGSEIDVLRKYSGNDYNCRLIIIACVYESGEKVFREEDLPDLRALPSGITDSAAAQIGAHIFNNFDAVKKP